MQRVEPHGSALAVSVRRIIAARGSRDPLVSLILVNMRVQDVINAVESIAPPELAESWDNVGLLVGDRDRTAEHVLLTIDLTSGVLDEAIRVRADTVIAYHPPLFHAVKRLTADDPSQRIVLRAIEHGIAIHSPHTALDNAEGGINDWLVSAFGSGDVRALQPHERLPGTEETKVVTYAPSDAIERLRNALAAIGAGRIGDYHQCSFEIKGSGTFHGGDSTNPTAGSRGRLERIEETRLEMVCPVRSLALAVTTIRQFHPYEEPPIEIHPLRPRPERHIGPGRRIVLDQPASLNDLIERIRKTIGTKRTTAALADSAPRKYHTIGLCAGAGSSLLDAAIAEGCEMFFTGEMSHHTILSAQARGCTVVLAGHTNTERGYLKLLKRRLSTALGNLTISISRTDGDPLRVM